MAIIVSIIFIIAPFISVPFIIFGMFKDKNRTWIYSILLAVVLGIIAYNLIPPRDFDLFRYNYLMSTYTNMSWSELPGIVFASNKALFMIVMFCISKIGNLQLLPLIITTLGYALVFFMVLDYSKIKNLSGFKRMVVILFFLGVFHYMRFASGLAQSLGFIIFAFAFYSEYIKHKKGFLYKSLYVVSALIHYTLFIPVALRILLKFDYKKYKVLYIVLLAIYALFPNLILEILKVFNDNNMFSSLISKADMYLFTDQSVFVGTYNIAKLVLLAFLTFIFFKNKKSINLDKKFICMIEMLLFFCFASIQYTEMFLRFNDLVLIMMLIYIVELLANGKQNTLITCYLIMFALTLGIVNVNMIMTFDFGNIFNNFYQNVFVMLG